MIPRSKCSSLMFSATTPNDTIVTNGKFKILLPKTQSLTKIWIASLVLCFAICITVVSITIWVVTLMKDKQQIDQAVSSLEFTSNVKTDDPYLDEIYKPHSNRFSHNGFEVEKFENTLDKTFEEDQLKKHPNEELNSKNSSGIREKMGEIAEDLTDKLKESIKFKNIVYKAVESFANVAVDEIKTNTANLLMPKSTQNDTKTTQNDLKTTKKTTTNNEDKPAVKSNNEFIISNKNISVIHSVSLLNETNVKDPEDNTQISSPDGILRQVTTNRENLLKQDHPPIAQFDFGPIHNQVPDNKAQSVPITKPSGYFNIFGSKIKNSDEIYSDPDDYFYSDLDTQAFYYDYERVTWAGYVLEKIQEFYDWVTTDFETNDGTISKGNEHAPLPQILKALNQTLIQGDASVLFMKLRDIYYAGNGTEFNPERSRKMITNTSNVVSFGLLALDVILLRNIQLIAWEDKHTANSEMARDLDVFALNAIFMDPSQVKKIYDNMQMADKEFKHFKNDRISDKYDLSIEDDEPPTKTDDDFVSNFYNAINIAEEVIQFMTSTFRAVMHLGQAFRNARRHLKTEKEESKMMLFRENIERHIPNALEIDCIWTLYCRNLDKATKFTGPYGFLAKLNSVGLRLVLGDIRLERVVETLIEETLTESKKLHCDKMFPKCSREDASKIVLQEIIKNQ